MIRSLALATFLLVPLGAASAQDPARSEATPLPSDDELARSLAGESTTGERAYETGVLLHAAGSYEAAERAWLRALSLGAAPTLWVAVADARERRGDEPGTVTALEQYLVERPDAPDRAAIEARMAKLLRSPAKLVIRTPEGGAAIRLDGVPLGQRTPAEIEVEPGSHTVVVVANGIRVAERTVQLTFGEVKELDFAPEPPSELVAAEAEHARLEAQREKEREDRIIRRAVISTGTIAAAALVPGTVLAVLSADGRNSDEPSAEADRSNDRLRVFANVSFGIAALSAITSLTLFMTHKNQRARERQSARLRIDLRGGGATATVKF